MVFKLLFDRIEILTTIELIISCLFQFFIVLGRSTDTQYIFNFALFSQQSHQHLACVWSSSTQHYCFCIWISDNVSHAQHWERIDRAHTHFLHTQVCIIRPDNDFSLFWNHKLRIGSIIFVGKHWHFPTNQKIILCLLDDTWALEAHNGESFLFNAVQA